MNEREKRERIQFEYTLNPGAPKVGGAYVSCGRFYAAAEKEQYAAYRFENNGIYIQIMTERPDFTKGYATRMTVNRGLFLPQCVLNAYGLEVNEKITVYRNSRFVLYIAANKQSDIDLKSMFRLPDQADTEFQKSEVISRNTKNFDVKGIMGSGKFMVTFNMEGKTRIEVRRISGKEQGKFLSEMKVKELFGENLQRLPYHRFAYISQTGILPSKLLETFDDSIEVRQDQNGDLLLTKPTAMCPLSGSKIDFSQKNPRTAYVAEGTGEHLEEARELIRLGETLYRRNRDLVKTMKTIKEKTDATDAEKRLSMKYRSLKEQYPDNLMLQEI